MEHLIYLLINLHSVLCTHFIETYCILYVALKIDNMKNTTERFPILIIKQTRGTHLCLLASRVLSPHHQNIAPGTALYVLCKGLGLCLQANGRVIPCRPERIRPGTVITVRFSYCGRACLSWTVLQILIIRLNLGSHRFASLTEKALLMNNYVIQLESKTDQSAQKK